MFGEAFLVGPARVLFLKVGAVAKHDIAELGRCPGAMDRPPETAFV